MRRAPLLYFIRLLLRTPSPASCLMGHAKSRANIWLCMRGAEKWIYEPFLQQIRGLGRSVDTTEEREIRNRVTAAKSRLWSGTNTRPETYYLSRVQRARRRGHFWRLVWHDLSATTSASKRRAESVGRTWRTTRGSVSLVRSLTCGAPWMAQRVQSAG